MQNYTANSFYDIVYKAPSNNNNKTIHEKINDYIETRQGKHLLCKQCKNDTGYADSKKHSLSLTKDHLKYILSLDDKSKRLIKDKLFKKSKDLTQIQLDSLTVHCTDD